MKHIVLTSLAFCVASVAIATEDPALVRDTNMVDERETINWVDEDTTTSIATPIFLLEAIATENNPASDTMNVLTHDPVTKEVTTTPIDELPTGVGGGGDHGGLTGLADDDHTQYVLRTDNVEDLVTGAAVGEGLIGLGGSAFGLADLTTQAELNSHASSATAHHAAPSASAPGVFTGYAWSGDIDAMTEDDAPGSASFMWVDRASDGAARKLSLADLAQYAVGGVGGAGNFRGARAYSLANQAIPSNVGTALTFGAEEFDTDALHSNVTNTSRFTASVTGYYLLVGRVFWASSTLGTFRTIAIRKNGTTTLDQTRTDTVAAGRSMEVATVAYLTAGDYVEVVVAQDSGAALNSVSIANWAPYGAMVLLPDGHDPVVLTTNGYGYVSQSGQTLSLLGVTMNSDIDGWILPFDLSGTPTSEAGHLPDSGVTGGGAGNAWADPGYITALDGNASLVNNVTTASPSEELIATDFDFAIPDGSLIVGVEFRGFVSLDQNIDNTGSADNAVYLVVGGVNVGDNKASASVWPLLADAAYRTWGGSSDTWGTLLTPSEVNSTSFGMSLRAGGATVYDYYVNVIECTIYYEVAGGEYVVAVDSTGVLRAGPGTVDTADETLGIRIDQEGRVAVGAAPESMTLAGTSTSPHLAVHDDGTNKVAAVMKKAHATAGTGPVLAFARALGTLASPTVVASGSNLGSIPFWGWDGTDWAAGAEISADVSTTPGSNDMPTTLNFKTSADGSGTPTSRMTINHAGTVNIAAVDGLQENSVDIIASDEIDTIAKIGDRLTDDPADDRIVFFDKSANTLAYLSAGSGLTISGTTISASGGGGGGSDAYAGEYGTLTTLDPAADLFIIGDDSATTNTQMVVNAWIEQALPVVAAARSSDQTISNNTETEVAFDVTLREDIAGMHDTATNNGRLIAVTAGTYEFWGEVEWDSTSSAQFQYYAAVVKNTATTVYYSLDNKRDTTTIRTLRVHGTVSLSASDYLTLRVYQISGGNLNVNSRNSLTPNFSMRRIGP